MNDACLTRNESAKYLGVSAGRVCGLGRKARTCARSRVALRSQRSDLNETRINRGDLPIPYPWKSMRFDTFICSKSSREIFRYHEFVPVIELLA